MLSWQWIVTRLRKVSVKAIIYVIFMEAVVNAIWAGIARLIVENPMIKDVGYLVMSVFAIFAVVWYLTKRSTEQMAVPNISLPADIVQPGTQGDMVLTESPTWEQVYNGVEYLAGRITEDFKPEVILGISSGGAVIAGMLSRLLNKPLTNIIRSDPQLEETAPAESTTIYIPYEVIAGKRALLVDDIVVSGNTLLYYINEISNCETPPKKLETAALLLVDAHGQEKPGFHVFRTSNLEVRMPWDYIKKTGKKPVE